MSSTGSTARFGVFTDIYALGATLYHLLTGEMPIQATDRATGVELPALKAINPKVSRNVSDAVMWALEMRVEKRPQTIRDFLIAMRGTRPRSPILPKRTHNGIDQGRNGAADCPGNGMGRGQDESLRFFSARLSSDHQRRKKSEPKLRPIRGLQVCNRDS